jgi:Zn-dependent protease
MTKPVGVVIARVSGTEVRASRSWVFVFLFVALLMAVDARKPFEALPIWVPILVGLGGSFILFLSLLFKLVAHCAAARSFGIAVKSVTLSFFGGTASLAREAARPLEEFVIAAAGPVANALLAGVLMAIVTVATSYELAVADTLRRLAGINVALAVFNLAPGLPLDGGRMLRAAVWWVTGSLDRATRIASIAGQVVAALCMMVGIAIFLLNDLFGLLIAFLGYYLYSRARASGFELSVRRALNGLTVGSMWLDTLPQVERSTTLLDFARQIGPGLDGMTDQHFMVVDEGVIYGVVAVSHVGRIPAANWPTSRVEDVMKPIADLEKPSFQTEIFRALEAMTRSDIGELPVVENNAVQGFVGREALLRFVSSRIAAQSG